MISSGFVRNIFRPSEGVSAAAARPERAHLELDTGVTGYLNPEFLRHRVWLDIATERRAAGLRVFLELDDDSREITQLLLPLKAQVEILLPAAEDLEVRLHISHARHWLRRTHPEFNRLRRDLEQARISGQFLFVTDNPKTHEIIHVQPTGELVPDRSRATVESLDFAPAPLTGISLAKAQEIFNLVAAETCAPLSPSSNCIPFLYPDDGCWGRAHQMARLISGSGVSVGKVWNYGNLSAATKNSPSCAVQWNWHVAVTVSVTSGGALGTYVIDPSLFSQPVQEIGWKTVQRDPNSTLVETEARVFHRTLGGSVVYDDNYHETAQVLQTYRQTLRNRSVSSDGPPPYQNCP